MIFIYIMFFLLIGFINRRTNVIFSLILGIFGLNYFLNGNDLILALQSVVAVPKVMAQNLQAVFLVVIVILLFILSNLLNLINIDFLVDRYVDRFSHRRQKLITFFITLFSTNLELSNSDIGRHHRKVFDLNSGIMPFLNPFSIIVIFISSLLIMFDTVNGIGVGMALFIILLNIPAIWWAFKTLVQLVFNREIDYRINKFNMNLIRPSIEVVQSRGIQKSLNGRRFLLRCIQFIVIPIVLTFIIPNYKAYVFIISYILILIAYTVYLGVKAVYEERIMPEEEIYRTMRSSILGIGPELVSFLLTLIFTSLSYDYIARYYANIYSTEQLYILSIIGLLIGLILFKDYLIGLAMALPITLIWITSDYSINLESIQMLYISLISIATLIQIIFLIDFKYTSKAHVIDLTMMCTVTVLVLAGILLSGFVTGVIIFAIMAISYLLYFMISRTRGRRDNIRHTWENGNWSPSLS